MNFNLRKQKIKENNKLFMEQLEFEIHRHNL